ncbi:MAG: multicopper oxidase family protein [Flavobacteriales bacterium]|nr:multicopper oxidase family protein [Flavobacteriales bacterium]
MKTYNTNSNRIHRYSFWAFIAIFFLSLSSSFGQERHEMFILKNRADVLDNAKPHDFFKIPELESKDGRLELDLFINEQVFNFNGDKVKLRAYTYKSGDKSSTKIGPWGPTLRIQRNDRLSITIHNNLPLGEERNYLGSMAAKISARMDDGGKVDARLKKVLVNATDSLITEANLIGATIDVIEKAKRWVINGKLACQCPLGEEGTCKKIDIEYPVEYAWNFGTEEYALRIYESLAHDGENHDHNIPHGFNNTNLHTHGFHVSPNQDDIFRNVKPSFSSYYTYDLVDHTAGTMWYHPHVHGSTGLQVASGMSGAIIIEDSKEVKEKYPNLAAASDSAHERIMIFNQINYDIITGELNDFNVLNRVSEPKGTTVNGVVIPKMEIAPGEVQRWGLIHSGYASSLGLEFPKEAKVWQIAVDGILFSEPQELETVHMAPGNRTDLLIQFPKDMSPGEFKVVTTTYNSVCEYFHQDDECKRNKAIDPDAEEIVHIIVKGDPVKMNVPSSLPGPGVGHDDIKDSEIVNMENPRRTSFDLVVAATDKDTTKYMINNQAFESYLIPDTLIEGTAEVWIVRTSNNIPHPYHIHINPFQVTEIGGREVNPPMWKDVVMASENQSLKIRSRYQKYIGDFVIHCHILSHEDQGMMQRVRIIPKKKKN